MASLADLFVSVRPDTDRFGPELRDGLGRFDGGPAGDKVGRSFVDGFGVQLRRLAGLAAAGFATLQVTEFVGSSVAAASDLQEAVNVTSLVFRENAKDLNGFFASSATSLGLSEAAARQASANIGGLLNNLGYTRAESADLSATLLTLGADLGSAFNKAPAEAVQAIGAALRGENEPIRAFNVQLDDASLKVKALELGLYDGTGALDAHAKAAAALALIQAQTSDIQGDFANTAAGFANQQRIAAAGTENLKQTIGQGLLPISEQLLGVYNDRLLPAFTKFAVSTAPAVQAGFEKASTGAQGLYDLVVGGDFTGALGEALDVEEDSGFVRAVLAVRQALTGIDTTDLRSLVGSLVGDSGAAGDSLGSIATSAATLSPLVGELAAQIPSLSDGLNVAATVFKFAADNVDTLAQLLPLLAAGFVAYKVAQIAANVAATAEPFIRVAQIIATRQLATANVALAASQQAMVASTVAATAATTGGTAASSVGALASIRQTAATIAASVAQRGAAAASAVMTGAQWLLNVALSANPIGLVVIAIAALVAGVIIAYKNSETFRDVVNGAWAAVKTGIGATVEFLRRVVPEVFEFILNSFLRFTPLGIIISHWGQIRAGVDAVVAFLRRAPGEAFEFILNSFLRFTPLGIIISHWGQIRSFVGDAARGARDDAVAALDGLRSGAQDKVGDLVATVRGLPGQITGALAGLEDRMFSAGVGVVRAIGRGITSMGSYLRDKAEDILGPLADLLPGSPVKAGPLRVLNDGRAGRLIARMIGGGLAGQKEWLAGVGDDVLAGLLPTGYADARISVADVLRTPQSPAAAAASAADTATASQAGARGGDLHIHVDAREAEVRHRAVVAAQQVAAEFARQQGQTYATVLG